MNFVEGNGVLGGTHDESLFTISITIISQITSIFHLAKFGRIYYIEHSKCAFDSRNSYNPFKIKKIFV